MYWIVGDGEVSEARLEHRWTPQSKRWVWCGDLRKELCHSLREIGRYEGDLDELKSFHHWIRFLPMLSMGERWGEES